MKIKTSILKNITQKALKGAGFNKLVPLTGMIGLTSLDNKLSLRTTDLENEFKICVQVENAEPFNCVVDCDKFSKLVSKISTDYTTLTFGDAVLLIKADGEYKLPIITDDNGAVEFNDIEEIELPYTINKSAIKSAKLINESSTADTLESPELTGYYVDSNNIITTNSYVLTFNSNNLLNCDNPYVLSKGLIDLLNECENGELKWGFQNNKFVFKDDEITIQGCPMSGEGTNNELTYPSKNIMQYADFQYESNCMFNKQLMLDVLDRISLFISHYDNNTIRLNFGRTGLMITDLNNNCCEKIKYLESENHNNYTCHISINYLKTVLLSNPNDKVNVYYGDDRVLAIKEDNIIQVICLVAHND